MSDEEVKTSFVADDKEMLAAYRRMMKEIEGYKKKLAEQSKAHKDEAAAAKAAAKAQEEAAKQAAKATEKAVKEKTAAEKAASQEAIRVAKEAARAQEKAAKDAERAASAAAKAQARAAKEAARESAKAQKEAAKEGADSLATYAAGFITVNAAIGLAKSLYSAWATEIHRVEEAHKTLHTEIVKTLSSGNDLKNAPQIEAALKTVPGMATSEATRAFASATGAAPGMGWQERMDIVKGAAPLAAMGGDVAAQTNLAAKLKQFDPSLSGANANDLALVMRKRGGEDAEKFGSDEVMSAMVKLKTAGLTSKQAMAVAMADVEADLPSKGIKALAESLYESDPNAGKPLKTKDDKAKAAFYKLNAQDRLKALQDKATAESILGSGGAMNMALIGTASEQMAAVDSAMTRDLVGEEATAFGKWGTGRLAAVQHGTAEQVEKRDDVEGAPWSRASALRARYAADQRVRGAWMWHRFTKDTELYARQAIASMTGGDQLTAVRQGIQNDINFNQGGGGNFARSDMPTKADAKIYDDLVKALRENTAATKANTPAAGAKKNIDGNNEPRF